MSSIDVVYAMGTETVGMPDGTPVPVIKGTHWPAGDPVVRVRPGLFSPDPRYGLLYSPSSPPPGFDSELNDLAPGDEFEAASAAPGEQRSVRRPGRPRKTEVQQGDEWVDVSEHRAEVTL